MTCADEAAVRRWIMPSKRVSYSSPHTAIVLKELEEDGLSDDICDAIAEDPKAMRAIVRRAALMGTDWQPKRRGREREEP